MVKNEMSRFFMVQCVDQMELTSVLGLTQHHDQNTN